MAGGEPTIHSEFFEISEIIRKNGMTPGLITNGRMFAYDNFARAYSALNPEYTQIMLFSQEQDVHDALSGVNGAFKQVVAGIKNIAGNIENVTISVPIYDENMNAVQEVADLVYGLGLRAKIIFTAADPFCQQPPANDNVSICMEAAAEAVSTAISMCLQKYPGTGRSFCWEGFAACQLKEHLELGMDSLQEDIVLVWEANAEDFEKLEGMECSDGETEDCLVCSLRTSCPAPRGGAHRAFVRIMPNAVGYIHNRSNELLEDDNACPAGFEFCAALHPFKDIAVRNGAAIDVYHTDRFYGNALLRTLKFQKEQLYLNISGKSQNLDFRTAFKRLVLHEKCRECVLHGTRSGVFTALEGNAFQLIEDEEKSWLANLKGRVLDVGCGKPLFPDILTEKIKNGEIEYMGVDVAPDVGEGISAVAVPFEEFEWDGPPFDHVILLRSYNHFRDPREVLGKAALLLKEGGLIHIFENGLFAMLKRDLGGKDKESQNPVYQHYRNHFSDDVVRLIEHIRGFKILHHSPVTSKCANQWFLTLQKIEKPLQER